MRCNSLCVVTMAKDKLNICHVSGKQSHQQSTYICLPLYQKISLCCCYFKCTLPSDTCRSHFSVQKCDWFWFVMRFNGHPGSWPCLLRHRPASKASWWRRRRQLEAGTPTAWDSSCEITFPRFVAARRDETGRQLVKSADWGAALEPLMRLSSLWAKPIALKFPPQACFWKEKKKSLCEVNWFMFPLQKLFRLMNLHLLTKVSVSCWLSVCKWFYLKIKKNKKKQSNVRMQTSQKRESKHLHPAPTEQPITLHFNSRSSNGEATRFHDGSLNQEPPSLPGF